jgi:hypothetical protein
MYLLNGGFNFGFFVDWWSGANSTGLAVQPTRDTIQEEEEEEVVNFFSSFEKDDEDFVRCSPEFHSKALQNIPKLDFLSCKYTIWQPWAKPHLQGLSIPWDLRWSIT